MDLFVLILLFVVGALLQAAGQKRQRQGRRPPAPIEAESEESTDVMAEFKRAMEQLKAERQRGPGRRQDQLTRPRPDRAPVAFEPEFEEEAESLEIEPEVISLETTESRPVRVEVDRDDEVEAVVAKRIEWAVEQAKGLSPADHRAFDQRIRRPEPPKALPPPVGQIVDADPTARLRRLMVWQEILGRPLALRKDR